MKELFVVLELYMDGVKLAGKATLLILLSLPFPVRSKAFKRIFKKIEEKEREMDEKYKELEAFIENN